jgi:hypothetical protein
MANLAQGKPQEAIWGEDDDAAQPIQASDQSGVLTNQIKGALGDVRTCDIPLTGEAEGESTVLVDGERLVEGLDYISEEDTLLLLDEACDSVLGDAEFLDVTYDCRP